MYPLARIASCAFMWEEIESVGLASRRKGANGPGEEGIFEGIKPKAVMR